MTRPDGAILAVGEVLFDVFPDVRRIGGAPFNFAFQMRGLGFPACFVSAVGADAAGDEIIEFMASRGMRTDGVQREETCRTGEVLVRLDDAGVPEYDILEDRGYDRVRFTPGLEALLNEDVALVCFGTLAQRAPLTRGTVRTVLDRLDPSAVRVCDLNLRQHYHSPDLIEECLALSDIVKINDEELRAIMDVLGCKGDERDCCASIVERFALRCLCVTRGADGSELHLPDGGRAVQGPVEVGRPAPDTPMDTVGAGDAFTAMLCAGHLRGLPWEKAIATASRFAAALCAVRGALPETDDFYLPFKEELERAHR